MFSSLNSYYGLYWALLVILLSANDQAVIAQTRSASDNTDRNLAQYSSRMHVASFKIEGVEKTSDKNISYARIIKIVEDFHAGVRNGYDIDTLRELTDTITQHYRQSGYFLASAYIPEQTIKDGVVTVRILTGTITQIVPENNQLYSDRRLIRALKYVLEEPANSRTIESAMLHLNDYPGLETAAVFSPGETLGTARLTLNTNNETGVVGSITLDNYGNEFTGRYRLGSHLTTNNLLGFADQFDLRFIQTLDPTISTYGFINYRQPILRGISLGLSYSNNAYAVGDIFTSLGIEGDSEVLSLYGRYNFKRSKVFNIYTQSGLTSKSANSEGGGNDLVTTDELDVFSLSIGFDGNDNFFGGRHFGELILYQGLTEADLSQQEQSYTPDTDGKFNKLNLNYAHTFALENMNNQYIIANLRMQYTDSILSSLEQIPLGGPQNVRAFSVSQYLADTAIIINAEWVFRTLPSTGLDWTKNIQASAYLDYGYGALNESPNYNRTLTASSNSVTLKGVGFSLQLSRPKGYQIRTDLAIPLGEAEPNDDSGIQFLFNFSYKF